MLDSSVCVWLYLIIMNSIEQREIKIFISSTFLDLKEERDILIMKTFPILRKLALERNVTLTEVDLRWGITAEESKSGKLLDICLSEIDCCIPFFIGILSNRYGWIPSKENIYDYDTLVQKFQGVSDYIAQGLSVTEMEMQYGVLNREETIDAFFYINENEADRKDIDSPDQLSALKDKVRFNHRYPVNNYSDPEDLALKVTETFISLLDKYFPLGSFSEMDKLNLPHKSQLSQLCQNYVVNEELYKQLDQFLMSPLHYLTITGLSGAGKSSLWANWIMSRKATVFYHFVGMGDDCNYENILGRFQKLIETYYGFEIDTCRTLEQQLSFLSEKGESILFVIDGVEKLDSEDNGKDMTWLPKIKDGIKILFTTVEDDPTYFFLKKLGSSEINIPLLNRISAQTLIVNELRRFGKKLTPEQMDLVITDGRTLCPVVLKSVINELLGFGNYEEFENRIRFYLSGKTYMSIFQRILLRLEDAYGKRPIQDVFSFLTISHIGLSEYSLRKITGLKPFLWSQVFSEIVPYLTRVNGRYKVSSTYLLSAISYRYLSDKSIVNNYRQRFLSYLSQVSNQGELTQDELILCFRGGLYQCYQMQDVDTLIKYLSVPPAFLAYSQKYPIELKKYLEFVNENKGLSFLSKVQIAEPEDKKCYAEYILSVIENCHLLDDYETAAQVAAGAIRYISSELVVSWECQIKIYSRSIEAILKSAYYEQFSCAFQLALKKLISLCKSHQGDRCGSLAEGMLLLADLNSAVKAEIDDVIMQYQKVIELYENIGMEYMNLIVYQKIGDLYEKHGEYKKQLLYYLKGLEISETVNGKLNQMTGNMYKNIMLAYHNLGQHDNVLEYGRTALYILKQVLGEEYPDVCELRDFLGEDSNLS